MANSATIIALVVVMLALLSAMVLSPILLVQLFRRHWWQAAKLLVVLAVVCGIGAEAGDIGVRYGHWNDLIRAHCKRDAGTAASTCP